MFIIRVVSVSVARCRRRIFCSQDNFQNIIRIDTENGLEYDSGKILAQYQSSIFYFSELTYEKSLGFNYSKLMKN